MLQPTQGRLTMKIQRRLILGVASLAALHSGYGLALGLGDLHLQSALNQPLAATIELRDVAGIGPGDIRASLASAEAFERAGIERPFFLTDLRFVPTVIDSRLVIRVESRDRKSTRLRSSHVRISYAVFCLNKIKRITTSVSSNRE